MYQVSQTIISKSRYPELYNYFLSYCSLSKNLYNASLYRLRQNFTSFSKEVLTSNENEVKKEIELTVLKTGLEKPKYSMNYRFLEKLMRVTNNSDFFTYLPMQTAQAVLKDAVNDYVSVSDIFTIIQGDFQTDMAQIEMTVADYNCFLQIGNVKVAEIG